VPIPVGLRLFLPNAWTDEPQRCAAAGVADAEIRSRSNGGIVLAELDRLRTAGVRFGTVLADAGYGASAEFGHGLEAREQRWAVGLLPNQPVYDVDVQLVPPIGGKQCLVPDKAPRCAEYVRVLMHRPVPSSAFKRPWRPPQQARQRHCHQRSETHQIERVHVPYHRSLALYLVR
jgi:SRSO17 transposase